jgi:hypothetical protein
MAVPNVFECVARVLPHLFPIRFFVSHPFRLRSPSCLVESLGSWREEIYSSHRYCIFLVFARCFSHVLCTRVVHQNFASVRSFPSDFSLLLLPIFRFVQIRRLPTLHSHMVALEISLGREATIDYQDYLNGSFYWFCSSHGCSLSYSQCCCLLREIDFAHVPDRA